MKQFWNLLSVSKRLASVTKKPKISIYKPPSFLYSLNCCCLQSTFYSHVYLVKNHSDLVTVWRSLFRKTDHFNPNVEYQAIWYKIQVSPSSTHHNWRSRSLNRGNRNPPTIYVLHLEVELGCIQKPWIPLMSQALELHDVGRPLEIIKHIKYRTCSSPSSANREWVCWLRWVSYVFAGAVPFEARSPVFHHYETWWNQMFIVTLSVMVCRGADNLDSLQFHIIIIDIKWSNLKCCALSAPTNCNYMEHYLQHKNLLKASRILMAT
jgi:hypothetical protein